MSAYALPGSLFFPPPMVSYTPTMEETTAKNDVGETKARANVEEEELSSTSVSAEINTKSRMNDTIHDDGCFPTEDAADSSTTIAEADFLNHQHVSPTLATSTTATSTPSSTATGITELLIAVQSATVDPIRLLKSLSTMRAGDVAYEAGVAGSRLIRHGLERMGSMVATSSSSPPSSDEAIEFHLRITFNGQKYTVTRTLPCFRQLRDDIIAELQARSEGARRRFDDASRAARRRIIGETAVPDSHHHPPLHKRDSSDEDADTADFLSVHGDDWDGQDEEDEDDQEDQDVSFVIIPELPPMETASTPSSARDNSMGEREPEEEVVSWSNSMPRFAGRSLSRLHAAVKLYAPVMEGWLRQVADIVPPNSSPSLMQFLLEPLMTKPKAQDPTFGETMLDTWNRTTGYFFASLPAGTATSPHKKPPQRRRQEQRKQVFQLDAIDENKEVVAESVAEEVISYDSDLDEDDVGEFFHATVR